MVKRDITSVYKQTILGPVWMIIQPIFTTAIYTFTFSSTAKMSTDNIPPVLFYLIGQVFWNYFSDSLNKTSNTFIANAGVFGKVYFPRLVMPISVIISNLVKLGIQLGLLLIIYLYYYFTTDSLHPNIYILFVPIFIIFLGIFGLSLGVIFSSLTTKYRDFTFLLGFAVQLIMFASCVVFPLSMYSQKIQNLLAYNPIVTFMEAIRFSLTGNGSFNIVNILISQAIIILFLFFGIIMFSKTEKTFMDSV
ncbi:MAG: ABC transporter permease [Bacteroidetes bacterium]|nr:ABC transporter permease [Bacteroidota bacterium]